jgi:hypothetical protein
MPGPEPQGITSQSWGSRSAVLGLAFASPTYRRSTRSLAEGRYVSTVATRIQFNQAGGHQHSVFIGVVWGLLHRASRFP